MSTKSVQEIASEALLYLSETDELEAQLHTNVERLGYKVKQTLGAYMLHEEGTNPVKEAKARNSDGFKEIVAEELEAIQAHKEVKNKRSTQTMRFEWARSMNANRRQGGGNI